jgi:hypothetical protein
MQAVQEDQVVVEDIIVVLAVQETHLQQLPLKDKMVQLPFQLVMTEVVVAAGPVELLQLQLQVKRQMVVRVHIFQQHLLVQQHLLMVKLAHKDDFLLVVQVEELELLQLIPREVVV